MSMIKLTPSNTSSFSPELQKINMVAFGHYLLICPGKYIHSWLAYCLWNSYPPIQRGYMHMCAQAHKQLRCSSVDPALRHCRSLLVQGARRRTSQFSPGWLRSSSVESTKRMQRNQREGTDRDTHRVTNGLNKTCWKQYKRNHTSHKKTYNF